MKRFISFALGIFFVVPLSAEFALVYKSENDVKQTVFAPGLATAEGITVSAAGLMSAGENLMAGLQGQELKKAFLIRFDNDLGLALLRLGEPVKGDALQTAHKKNSDKVTLFLPELGLVSAAPSVAASTPAVNTGEKFLIRLNGVAAGSEPIPLEKKRKKADVVLEVVGHNIESLWRVSVDVKAEPRLSFWKKGDQRGLNAIPQPSFHFSQQVLFVPFSPGKSIKIPIEISDIKEENYELHIKVDSKAGPFETKVPVRFVNK